MRLPTALGPCALVLLSLAACSAPPPPVSERPRALRPPVAQPVARASAPPAKTLEPALGPAPVEAKAPQQIDVETLLQTIGSEARAELGARASAVPVRGMFVLIAPGGADTAQSALPFVDSALEAYFQNRFRNGPSRPIGVYLFGDAGSYDKYCQTHWQSRCPSIYGFYDPDSRRLIMNIGLGLGTLTHELVHPIVEADFPNAPTWINEGIASLYEAPVMPRRGEIHGRKNWRLPRLKAALGSVKEASRARPEQLFAMSNETFRGDGEDLHYAMARYLCQWLDEQGWLWPFYQAWRDHYDQDPTGAHAFERVTGMTPAAADEKWIRWVRGL